MKTFESELQEIRNWEDRERLKLDEETIKKYGRGYDGGSTEKYKEISHKAFEMVMALKKKYDRKSIY